jgi:hypothetical protein
MVDKVDRPEAPPTWKIKEPARTKDDRRSRQQEESKEQKKEKFEKRASEGRWQKFDSRTMVIKPIRVPLRDIKGFRFCSVTIHSGVATMEADMDWVNGRITEGTMVRIGGFEEYVKANHLSVGEGVPRELWAKSDPLEVGIPQEKAPSGSYAAKELEREAEEERKKKQAIPKKRSLLAMIGLKNKRTGEFQWTMLIFYLLIATGLGLAIHALLTMTRI